MDRRYSSSLGFTLIELLVAVSLVAILLAVGLPSYQSLRQEQMVRAATSALYTDMMLLKSEAIKRNQPLSLIVFNSGQSSWCYRIAIDAGSCSSCADSCSSVEGRKGVDASEFPGIALTTTSSYGGGKITFSPRRGTLSPGHIELSADVYAMHVVTSAIGRVSTCSVGSNISGVPLCN